MNKHVRWLQAELDRWVEEQVISPAQAAQLRDRYRRTEAGPSWGLIVFATCGAIVLGLGVILLFAYNWADMPKALKLALIFGAMLGAHGAALHLLAQPDWRAKLGEALAVLGTMFYGAAIWLVAQIYNIDEHFPNGFLFWALGALALAWMIRSTALGILAVALVGVWAGCEALAFNQPKHWAMLLLVLGLVPLAWRQRSAILLALCVVTFEAVLLMNLAGADAGAHLFTATLAFAVLLVGVARWTARSFAAGARILEGFGYGLFLVCAYLVSFQDGARHLLNWSRPYDESPAIGAVVGWTLFALATGAWAIVLQQRATGRAAEAERSDWLLPIALFYAFGLAALGARGGEELVAWSFAATLLGLAVWWMWRGCQESRAGVTILGSVVLTALVVARYFDLFQSLASRGLAFILLGALFIAEALYYRKRRRQSGGET
jgi:uncharacterized membrane protein